MADLAELQSRILCHLSSSGETQVAMDVLQHKLDERPERVSAAIRGLLEHRKIALHQSGASHASAGGGGGQPRIYLSLAHSDMSESFSLVYDTVRAAGASGIDQQQLAARLRMPKSDILKALRALTQAQKIQEQRSFTNRAKKVYLLFHLQPSAQVTGGTLYCGEDLDVALVDELRQRIVSFVSRFRSVGLKQIEQFVEQQTTAGGGISPSNPSRKVSDAGRSPDGDVEQNQFDLDALVKRESEDEDDYTFGTRGREGEQPGSPIAFIHSSGGGAPLTSGPFGPSPQQTGSSLPSPHSLPQSQRAATLADRTFPTSFPPPSASAPGLHPPPQHVSLSAKRIQSKDVRALMQTLVLDGVVDELLGPFRTYYASGGSNTDSFYASAMGHEEPRYQLATGGNVMRHFTAAPQWPGQRRRLQDPTPLQEGGTKRERETAEGGHQEEARPSSSATYLAVLQAAMAQEAVWGPADISRPSSLSPSHVAATPLRSHPHATGASTWAYMPAVGFPCLGCPQLANCSATGSGVMNRKDCAYLAEWLR